MIDSIMIDNNYDFCNITNIMRFAGKTIKHNTWSIACMEDSGVSYMSINKLRTSQKEQEINL